MTWTSRHFFSPLNQFMDYMNMELFMTFSIHQFKFFSLIRTKLIEPIMKEHLKVLLFLIFSCFCWLSILHWFPIFHFNTLRGSIFLRTFPFLKLHSIGADKHALLLSSFGSFSCSSLLDY